MNAGGILYSPVQKECPGELSKSYVVMSFLDLDAIGGNGMMKRLLGVLLGLLVCGLPIALADPLSETPPDEVLAHINRRWSDYTLEDYATVEGETDYGFALVSRYGKRELVGYRENDGQMEYYLRSQSAVPQGRGTAWINRDLGDGSAFEDGGVAFVGGQAQAFSVNLIPDSGEDAVVCYRMQEDGQFHLSMYHAYDSDKRQVYFVYPQESQVDFYTYGRKEKLGTAYGVLQTDIRYADLANMPKTLKHAKEKMSSAPDLPKNVFAPTEIKFEGGKKYDVYTGPGENFARSGKGKGSVSTNDWIQVFGRLGNWIMIQYDISADHFRIGWIKASALPKGAEVKMFDGAFRYYALDAEYANAVLEGCSLTDDPFNSRTEIAYLPAGTPISEVVYDYNGWSYIRVEVDGTVMFGFVPTNCIDHG